MGKIYDVREWYCKVSRDIERPVLAQIYFHKIVRYRIGTSLALIKEIN